LQRAVEKVRRLRAQRLREQRHQWLTRLGREEWRSRGGFLRPELCRLELASLVVLKPAGRYFDLVSVHNCCLIQAVLWCFISRSLDVSGDQTKFDIVPGGALMVH